MAKVGAKEKRKLNSARDFLLVQQVQSAKKAKRRSEREREKYPFAKRGPSEDNKSLILLEEEVPLHILWKRARVPSSYMRRVFFIFPLWFGSVLFMSHYRGSPQDPLRIHSGSSYAGVRLEQIPCGSYQDSPGVRVKTIGDPEGILRRGSPIQQCDTGIRIPSEFEHKLGGILRGS